MGEMQCVIVGQATCHWKAINNSLKVVWNCKAKKLISQWKVFLAPELQCTHHLKKFKKSTNY
jgi:hypothetical protein